MRYTFETDSLTIKIKSLDSIPEEYINSTQTLEFKLEDFHYTYYGFRDVFERLESRLFKF